jgi:pre-rRNA-processing protein TSR3
MFLFPKTIILRHRKENLKKCSLCGLEQRPDFRFFTYPKEALPDLSGYVLLTIDAPLLTAADRDAGIFLIDGTWNYAALMERQLTKPHRFERRSLPTHYRTAYPRRQQDCADPSRGLASVEALYVAYMILGRNQEGLLNRYHWRNEFFKLNDFGHQPIA